MYVLVGAHGSRTIRALGFHTSLQRLAMGQIGAAFGGLSGFWELSSQMKRKKQENTHFMCVLFHAYGLM